MLRTLIIILHQTMFFNCHTHRKNTKHSSHAYYNNTILNINNQVNINKKSRNDVFMALLRRYSKSPKAN